MMSNVLKDQTVFSSNEDIFHSVVMAEQNAWNKGFLEGQEEGEKRHFQDGFNLGAEKGVEVGSEIGFYAGYASHVLKIKQGSESKARVIKVCEAIKEMAIQCELLGPMDESLTENLSKLRGKFKQLTSLLGLPVEYKSVIGEKRGASF